MKKNYFITSLLILLISFASFGQACNVPANIAVTNVTATTANISWISSNNETQWEVIILPLGTPAPQPGTPGIVSVTSPYTVTMLSPCTSYDVYVRAICTPTTNSNWSAPVNFNTIMSLPANGLPNLLICGMNNSGFALFNLTAQTPVVLDGLNPATHTVDYYTTMQDASNSANPIATPQSYTNTTPFSQVIFVRVSDTATGCHRVISFNLTVNASPVVSLPGTGFICFDANTSTTTPYTISTGLSGTLHSFVWSLNGTPISGATGATFNATQEGVYSVTATDIVNGCTSMPSEIVLSLTNAPTATAAITNQTVTINVSGQGDFQFQIDNEPAQNSNIFTNVALGTHSIAIIPSHSSCGPLYLTVTVTTPSAPLGQPTQTFTPGQTLAHLTVNGQNIQWYANPAAHGLTTEPTLPLSTVLVNNTTYYASQTINGIESPDRLAVTVSTALNSEDFTFKKLAYYPNPVANTLTVSNQENFSNITVTNLLGQLIVNKSLNTNQYEMDFSSLSKGIYLIKVKAANQEKTFKIVKN